MRNKLLIILIFFIFSACEKIIKKEINSYDLITENSKVIISIKNIGKFKNNGYPTKHHREAIKKHGLTKYHRKSFKLFDEQLTIDF